MVARMPEPRTEAIVEARSLSKNYGETRAVREVTFGVRRGEVVGFLGPNGAGKSTTMKMLTGFLRPTGGSAIVGGIGVAEDPLGAQARIGYLPENAPLYDDMMVYDFLRFVGTVRGVTGEALSERMRVVCERCGLADVLGKDIGQLSKGYRQRVGLAQALIHDPDVLILDEPTSGLDPNQIVEIRSLIRELGQEKTVLLSTHILPEVQASCSRVIIISEGQLVADDTPSALIEGGAGAVVRLVVASADGGPIDTAALRARMSSVSGVGTVDEEAGEGAGTVGLVIRASGSDDPRPDLFRTAADAGFVLLEMHRERASLEETFRNLTRKEGRHA